MDHGMQSSACCLPEESKQKKKDSHIRVLNFLQVSMSRWALEITLVDITGVQGLEDCEDKISGCDLIALDMSGFSVSLRPQVSFAFCLNAHEPSATLIDKYRPKVPQTLDLPGNKVRTWPPTDASMCFV